MTAFNKTIGNIKPKAKDFLLKIRTKIPKYSIHYVLYKLLLSWLLISIFYIANSDISFTDFYYFEQIKLSVFICAVAVLWLIYQCLNDIDRTCLRNSCCDKVL